MAGTSKTYYGTDSDTLSIKANEAATVAIVKNDGTYTTNIVHDIIYKVDGDDAIASAKASYTMTVKIAGKNGEAEGTTVSYAGIDYKVGETATFVMKEIKTGVYADKYAWIDLDHPVSSEYSAETYYTVLSKDEFTNLVATNDLELGDVKFLKDSVKFVQNINGTETSYTWAETDNSGSVALQAFHDATMSDDNGYSNAVKALFQDQVDVTIKFEGYAKAQPEGASLTVNGSDVDTAATFVVVGKDGSYTGSRFSDVVEGTSANEKFNLGTSSTTADSITFKGFFGDDEVTVNKGESIDLVIKEANGSTNASAITKVETKDGLLISAENIYTMTAKVAVDGSDEAAQEFTFALLNTAAEGKPAVYQWVSSNIIEGLVIENKADSLKSGSELYSTDADKHLQITVGSGTSAVKYNLNNAVIKNTAGQDVTSTLNAEYDTDDNVASNIAKHYNQQYKGSILVKGYTDAATAADTATVKINGGSDIKSDDYNVTPDSATYTGSWLNEKVVSTSANEKFVLGTGTDEITFSGDFGNDTVVAADKEALTLNINATSLGAAADKQHDLISYSTDGSNITVTKAEVLYTLTATATSTATFWGSVPTADDFGTTESGTTTITFTLEKYPETGEANSETYGGKYMWRSTKSFTFPADYEDDGKHKAGDTIYLWLDDVKNDSGTIKIDDAKGPLTFVDVKQSIDGATAVSALEGFKSAMASKDADTVFKYNETLYNTQQGGSIVVQGYATIENPDASTKVIVHNIADGTTTNDKDLKNIVFSEIITNKNYTGSAFEERITVTKDNTQDVTINVAGGKNSVDVVSGAKGAVTVTAGDGANAITTGDGNDVITVGNGTNSGTITFADSNTATGGINAGNGDNKVTVGYGTNTIVTGTGKDEITVNGISDADYVAATTTPSLGTSTITAGAGDDTIVIGENASAVLNFDIGSGNDTITLGGGSHKAANDKIVLLNSTTGDTAVNSGLGYSVDGEDLVITRTSSYLKDNRSAGIDKITVKGFMGDTEPTKQVDFSYVAKNGDTATDTTLQAAVKAQTFAISGKDAVKGTWAKDAITTTGDATVTAGKGDDTITLAKDSTATLVFNANDGADTVTIGDAKKVVLQFNEDLKPSATGNTFKYTYEYAENITTDAQGAYTTPTLTITRKAQEFDSKGSAVTTGSYQSATTVNTVTISDYLTKGEGKVYIGEKTLEEIIAASQITPAGATSVTGSFLSETLTGTTGADVIATGAGNDVITQTGGNDKYTLGKGDKFINSDFTTASLGNDTVTLTKDIGSLTLDFTKGETVNNVKLSDITSGYTTLAQSITDGSLTLTTSNGSVAITDYLTNGEGKVYVKYCAVDSNGNIKTDSEGKTVYETKLLEEIVPAKDNVIAPMADTTAEKPFEGTFLAETINNGAGKADFIAGGKGANIYNFNVGDSAVDSEGKVTGDTLIMTGENEQIIFNPATPKTGSTFDYEYGTEFSKDRKDIIITIKTTETVTATGVKTETTDIVTLKNYLDGAAVGTTVTYEKAVKDAEGKITGYTTTTEDLASWVDTSALIVEKGSKITGTNLDDKLVFDDNKSRTIYGEGGNDYIEVFGGKNTIYGGDGDDTIKGGYGADKIYGGAGNDLIYAGQGNDTIDAGEGTNTIVFYEGDGKDTVVNGGGTDTINIYLDDDSAISTSTKGNDLVISYGGGDDTITLKDYVKLANAGKQHSVTTVNYYDNSGKTPSLTGTLYTTIATAKEAQGGIVEITAPEVAKATTVKGSTLSETITGSAGNNTLKGGGGNDIIFAIGGNNKVQTQSRAVDTKKGIEKADNTVVFAGVGNDVITAGKGTDTYYFDEGKLNGTITANTVGKTIVDLSASAAITTAGAPINWNGTKFSDLGFTVSGKNLLITNTYDAYGLNIDNTETLTLKNALNGKLDKNLFINDGSGAMNIVDYLKARQAVDNTTVVLGNEEAIKKQKVAGTFLDETIVGGFGNDTITTGAGKDTVLAGLGNDKITGYIAKDGKTLIYDDKANAKSFVFEYAYDADDKISLGSGKDTIVNAKAADTITFKFDNDNIKDAATQLANVMTFNQKGKNLVIEYDWETVKGKSVATDSITISNYYKLDADKQAIKNIAFADEDGNVFATIDLTKDVKDGKLTNAAAIADLAKAAEAAYTNATTHAADTDYTLATDTNDVYTFTAARTGTKTVTDSSGNDTYKVANLTNAVTINDSAGNDKLVVTDINGYAFAYFNAAKTGTTAVSDDLYILDTVVTGNTNSLAGAAGGTVNGGVVIKDYFEAGDANRVETIDVQGAGGANFANLDQIKTNVVAWLDNQTTYNDAAAALSSGTAAATELINIYMGQAS